MVQAGYRLGRYKLLWGEHTKGDWYNNYNNNNNNSSRAARKLNNKIDWEQLQIKLVEDLNLVDLEEADWDMEDNKRVPATNPSTDFEVEMTMNLYKVSQCRPFLLALSQIRNKNLVRQYDKWIFEHGKKNWGCYVSGYDACMIFAYQTDHWAL